MVHTVGLLGANGRVGGATLPHLLKAHEEGRIKLTLLFQVSSSPKATLPASVEIRQVDYAHASSSDFDGAVKGIDVFLSTMGVSGLQRQLPIVEAMARVGDIKTFIPSRFGAVWSPDQFKDSPQREEMESMINAPSLLAQKLGVGVTKVNAGLFDEFAFAHNLAGMDVKANTIQANKAQLQNPFPITTVPYLGRALADLVTRPPAEIVNQSFSYVEFWVTGNELARAMTEVHGSPTQIRDYTAKDEAELRKQVPMGSTSVAYRSNWAKGKEAFGYVNEQDVPGKGVVGLEDVMSKFL